jgi:hypothetical protein
MKTNKKNLRRVSVVVAAQTLYHLNHMAAMNGWGEKDIGRVIDKIVRTIQTEEEGSIDHE